MLNKFKKHKKIVRKIISFCFTFLILVMFIVFLYLNLNRFGQNNSNDKTVNYSNSKKDPRIEQALNNETCPISNMSYEKKVEKLNSFIEKFNATEDDLISEEKMNKIIEERSSLKNIYKEKESVQGEFEFGEDFDYFHLILCYSTENDEANKTFQHEMKHYEVLKKYNIPANFKISFFRSENNKIRLNRSVEIKFPESLTRQQIDKISYEALIAPDDISDLDMKAINEYEQKYK